MDSQSIMITKHNNRNILITKYTILYDIDYGYRIMRCPFFCNSMFPCYYKQLKGAKKLQNIETFCSEPIDKRKNM